MVELMVTAQDGEESTNYEIKILKTTRSAEDTSYVAVELIRMYASFSTTMLDVVDDETGTQSMVDFASDLVLELDSRRDSFIGRFAVSSVEGAVDVELLVLESDDLRMPDAQQIHDQFQGFVESISNGTTTLSCEEYPILCTLETGSVGIGIMTESILYVCGDDSAYVGIESCYLHDYDGDDGTSLVATGSSSANWYDVLDIFNDEQLMITIGGGAAGLILIIFIIVQCKKRELCCCNKSKSRLTDDFDFDNMDELERQEEAPPDTEVVAMQRVTSGQGD